MADAIARPIARPRAQASASARAGAGRYVVQPGDTLSGIASTHAIPGGSPAVFAANRGVIGPDPALSRPGTVLALPGGGAATRYTVGRAMPCRRRRRAPHPRRLAGAVRG